MQYHFTQHISLFLIDTIKIDLLFDDNSYQNNPIDFIVQKKCSFYFSRIGTLQLIMRLECSERAE